MAGHPLRPARDRLSSSVAGHPLRPARDRRLGEPLPHLLANPIWAHRRLGEPLPHLLANPIWAHLMARGPKVPLVLRRYAVLATVSSSYPPPSGSFPDITHPSAARRQSSKLLSAAARLACVRPAASVQSEP